VGADAAGTVPGTGSGCASFAVARNASRDQVILAAGVLAGPVTDLAGTIGRLVLASLMPGRRRRTSPRVVKRAMTRDDKPENTTLTSLFRSHMTGHVTHSPS
jgi:hypothetical protein